MLAAALASGKVQDILGDKDVFFAIIAFSLMVEPHPSVSVSIKPPKGNILVCELVSYINLKFVDDARQSLYRCHRPRVEDPFVKRLVALVLDIVGAQDGLLHVPRRFHLISGVPKVLELCKPRAAPQVSIKATPCVDPVTLVCQTGQREDVPKSELLSTCAFFTAALTHFVESTTREIVLPCDQATLHFIALKVRGVATFEDHCSVQILELALYLGWDEVVQTCVAALVSNDTLDDDDTTWLMDHPGMPATALELLHSHTKRRTRVKATWALMYMTLHSRMQ